MDNIIPETKLISLNSKYASQLNGTKKSRVMFDFTNIINKSKENLYITLAVQSAEIPASYYNVNDLNNTTSITRDEVVKSIVIPNGNYDASSYLALFETLYENAYTGSRLATAYDEITGKYSFQDDDYNIVINAVGSTSYDVIGGIEGINYTFSTSGVPTKMPQPANFLGITTIKVCSDNLCGTNVDSVQLKTTTLLDTISATAVPFGLTIFNSLGRETYSKALKIEEIDIQLKDQNDNLIDFNNVDWNITLIVNTHKRAVFDSGETTIDSAIIVNDKLRKHIEANEKVGSLEQELKNLQFQDDDDLII